MIVLRHLLAECVKLPLDLVPTEPAEAETPAQAARRLAADKEAAITELCALLGCSGQVNNLTRLTRDMINRERKATTAIAPGVAIPHVRSMQMRGFVMGFARARDPGIPFASLDGEPTRWFFLLASPPWEDRTYLQVYRELSTLIQDEEVMAGLMEAQTVQDVFNALRTLLLR